MFDLLLLPVTFLLSEPSDGNRLLAPASMKIINPRMAHVLKAPIAFALQVVRAFQANQGLLLAGAVAYYALLSIVPLLILMVIALSQVIEQDVLLATLRRALGRN